MRPVLRAMLFSAVALLLGTGSAWSQTPPTVAGVAKATRNTIVTIRTPSSTGSGVIVDASGVIVTNLHVVRGAQAATISLANGDSYDDVAVVDVDARRDIALLKIKAFGLTAAKLGNSDRVNVGDKVVLVSSPRGLEATVSDGVISASRDTGDGYRMLQTTAAASPGSSGGGLFNMAGELIAILTSKRTDGENLNFALPFNYVRGLLATKATMSLADLAAKYPSDDVPEASTTSPSGASAQDLARLARLLEQTGEKIEKANDTVWRAGFIGDHSKDITVTINTVDGIVLIMSNVTSDPVTDPKTLATMMRLSYNSNYAKLGFDKDRALVALHEADLATLDGARLKTFMRSVATIADDAVGVLVEPPLTTLTFNDGRFELNFADTGWTVPESTNDYHLISPNGEAFLKVMAERTEIPTDRVVTLALDNARKIDPALKVGRRGTRTVNGIRMTFQEFDATVNGVPITFVGHYYGGPEGSVQLLGWSARNLARDYRSQFDRLVDGLRVVRPQLPDPNR